MLIILQLCTNCHSDGNTSQPHHGSGWYSQERQPAGAAGEWSCREGNTECHYPGTETMAGLWS